MDFGIFTAVARRKELSEFYPFPTRNKRCLLFDLTDKGLRGTVVNLAYPSAIGSTLKVTTFLPFMNVYNIIIFIIL